MNSDSDSCWIKSPVLIKSANKTSPCRQRASEQTSWWHLILIHVIRASLLNNIQKQAGSKGGHMSKHQNWDLIQICSVSDAFWDLCRGLSGKWSGTLSESCFLVLKESLNVFLWQEADQRWRSEVSDVRLSLTDVEYETWRLITSLHTTWSWESNWPQVFCVGGIWVV